MRLKFGMAEKLLNRLQSCPIRPNSSRWASTNHRLPEFAVYCSPIADVIAHHGIRYHQYADELNPDKSKALIVETTNQLCHPCHLCLWQESTCQ